MSHPTQEFTTLLQQSLQGATFVKLSLGAYRGAEGELQAIHARKILVKRQEKVSFTYRYKTRDIVKNYSFPETVSLVEKCLTEGFTTASLFTTEYDAQLELGATPRLKRSAASQTSVPSAEHDRAKQRLIKGENAAYLYDLKITDASGKVIPSAQDKFRQINKYVEILSGLIKPLPKQKTLRVVDMGSGKGYLTFALYDYLVNTLGLAAQVTGVEYRKDMVELCNRLAQKAGFAGLQFIEGAIDAYDCSGAHIVIALHACDTATDDALAKAIKAEAELIVVAPCCHKQIRREMEKANTHNDLDFLTRHGTFLERQAEMVTDGMRAQLLEYSGYQTKLFEFISDAHTPKNVMIVATKNKTTRANAAAFEAIMAAKKYFGIGYHHLERALGIA